MTSATTRRQDLESGSVVPLHESRGAGGDATPSTPHSEVAEAAVLGGVLANRPEGRKACATVIATLPPEAFYRDAHRTLWRAIQASVEAGHGVDVVSIGERLQKSGDLDRVGGYAGLSDMADSVPGTDVVSDHAELLRDLHSRREVARIAKEAVRRVEEGGEGAPEVYAYLTENLRRVRVGASHSFRFLSAEDMEAQGRPGQLVDGLLPEKGIGVVAGAPGCGKTFLTLEFAACIASGRPVLGRFETTPGETVYVCAEGSLAFGERIKAWKAANQWAGRLPLTVVPQELNLMEPAGVAVFIQEALAFLPTPPALVVLDTLSLCMLGGEENAASDMNRVISSAKSVRDGLDCAVLIVHHAGHGGNRERGSTALRGGVDTMAFLEKREDDTLLLKCEKQKDQEPFEPVRMELRTVGRSCVVGPTSGIGPTLNSAGLSVLTALHRSDVGDGLTSTEWEAASQVAKSTFMIYRKLLLEEAYVARDKSGRGARYSLTDAGRTYVR